MVTRQRKHRPSPSASTSGAAHLIWGYHAILEALRSRSRPLHKVFIAKQSRDRRAAELVELARAARVPIQRVDRVILDRLAHSTKHQGVIASVAAKEYTDAEDVLNRLTADSLLVILDQVEDPHNLGAVIRTAHCAGADALIVTKHRSAGLSDVVAKVSAGAVEYLPIARVTNLASFLDRLKDAGVRVIGVDPAGQTDYADCQYTGGLAFVFGREGKGLRRLTRRRCQQLVSIPMKGRIDSLNLSVSLGIVLFEVLRQRTRSR